MLEPCWLGEGIMCTGIGPESATAGIVALRNGPDLHCYPSIHCSKARHCYIRVVYMRNVACVVVKAHFSMRNF